MGLPGDPRREASEDGFSLIEVMVALVVFALFTVAVAAALFQALHIGATNRDRVVAANLAARQIDLVRGVPSDQILTSAVLHSPPQSPIVVNGTTYYLQQQVQYVGLGNQAQTCGGLDVVRISVEVSWARMGGVPPVRSDTIRRLGQAGLNPAYGSVSVTVTDAAGNPDGGLPVTLIAPTGVRQVQTTDSAGCAIFPQEPAATSGYSLELNTPGWMDPAGQQDSLLTGISVTPSANTAEQMTYSRQATLQILLDSGNYRPPTSPSPVAVTIRNNAGTRVITQDPGASSYTTAVVPVPEGYQAWAGDCADANPVSWPGGTPPPAISVSAGQTATGTARMVGIVVSGAPAGTPVYAVHAPDSSCVNGEYYLLGFGGGTVQAALPYGRWTLASNSTLASPPPGGWTQVSLTPTGPNPVVVAGNF